ncbi:EexN family lipoprotein [Sphingomonas citri]|uniref:EexN family lipoprotein n=1 Tax=Sphingomonas citri TaxID=2862499 RepID=UPI0027E4A4E5|nr:EexN family lipoprotein [Sphingomonas citri]
MRAPALAASLVLASLALAGCGEATHDVDYYKTNGEERTAKIKECNNNPGELGMSPNCRNAKKALNDLALDPNNKKVPVIR